MRESDIVVVALAFAVCMYFLEELLERERERERDRETEKEKV